ncbi:Mu-like prophage major head subunit gpT family protein [Seohaeicola saemankumensis]|uniref:Mu-like prophage major head subunit gpT family protein n=1 Tax=Seohaeicola saemankumensis TaxID=481181 RepID=A0ABW3T8D1_9RHOB
MLDQETPPAARDLARVRAHYGKNKLDGSIADAVLSVTGDVQMAEGLRNSAGRIHFAAELAGLSLDEGNEILRNALASLSSEDAASETRMKAKAIEEIALDDILTRRKVKAETEKPVEFINRTTATVGHSWDHGDGFCAKMTAGLSARLNPKEATAMGRDAAQFSMGEIAMQSCRNAGLKPFDYADAIRMASHTTPDFPLILEGSISNDVARQIEQRMPDLVRASHEVAREDYRAGNALSLSASGMPQEVAEGGEIQFVTMEEKGEALPTVRDFASGFNISNQALQNDSTAIRLMSNISSKMTEGAVERLRQVLLAPIAANSGNGQFMSDTKTMFHVDHGNLAGTGATISITSLTEARLALRKMTGLKGELRPVDPWALVVPAELETAAQQVVAAINAATSDDVNPFSGTLEIIVEPGLSDDAAWYLIGNPARHDGLAHAFLDGQRTPRVESRAGWNTLGMEFRLTWALDAKFIETATWFRNPGA